MKSTAREVSQRALIEGSQGLVKAIASRVHSNVPRYVELDDLIGYGEIGLAEAARDFDPGLGNQFSTFAYYRIRGAIYDGLAKMTWTSRSTYRRMRYEQNANEVLEAEATASADTSDWTLREHADGMRKISGKLLVVNLTTYYGTNDGEPPYLAPEDTAAMSPAAAVALNEILTLLGRLINELPADARDLIRHVYFDRQTLTEAARKLNISKSWASRLHAKVLEGLAQSLREVGVPDMV